MSEQTAGERCTCDHVSGEDPGCPFHNPAETDPTAGEREAVTDPDTGIVYFPDDPTPNPYAATPAAPDADDASEPLEFIRRLVGAWDCCGTCAGGVLAQRDRAREAAAATRARAEAWDEGFGTGVAYERDRDQWFPPIWRPDNPYSLEPDTPARTKPTTASLLADLAATREADQGAREKRALGGAS